MSLKFDTLSWIRANQSLILLISYSTARLAVKQHIPILQSLFFTRPGHETTFYHTRGEQITCNTMDAVKTEYKM